MKMFVNSKTGKKSMFMGKNLFKVMIPALSSLTALATLSSCSDSPVKPNEIEVHDTIYVNVDVHDTTTLEKFVPVNTLQKALFSANGTEDFILGTEDYKLLDDNTTTIILQMLAKNVRNDKNSAIFTTGKDTLVLAVGDTLVYNNQQLTLIGVSNYPPDVKYSVGMRIFNKSGEQLGYESLNVNDEPIKTITVTVVDTVKGPDGRVYPYIKKSVVKVPLKDAFVDMNKDIYVFATEDAKRALREGDTLTTNSKEFVYTIDKASIITNKPIYMDLTIMDSSLTKVGSHSAFITDGETVKFDVYAYSDSSTATVELSEPRIYKDNIFTVHAKVTDKEGNITEQTLWIEKDKSALIQVGEKFISLSEVYGYLLKSKKAMPAVY